MIKNHMEVGQLTFRVRVDKAIEQRGTNRVPRKIQYVNTVLDFRISY